MSSRHFEFGTHRINIAKLKQNVLSLSRLVEGKSVHVMTELVGDDLRNLLLDYKDYKKFDISRFNELKPDQKLISNLLLKKTGMDDRIGIRISNEELTGLIERYELLRGEILAGQDSIEVRKELRHVVLKLVRMGCLPKSKSFDLLLELALLEA